MATAAKAKKTAAKKEAVKKPQQRTAVEEFEEQMPVTEEVEDDDDLERPGDIIPIEGDFVSDESLLVESYETNCVYLSKVKSPGQRFYLIKEKHFVPAEMIWVNRSNRRQRSRNKFKQRATRGTFRDAMQELAVGGGGDGRDEPLS